MIGRGVGVSRATALYAAYGAHPARPLKPSPLRFFVDLGFSQKHHCSDFLWICDSYKKHHGSDFLWIFTKKTSLLWFFVDLGFSQKTSPLWFFVDFHKKHLCSDFLWIWDFYKKYHRSDFHKKHHCPNFFVDLGFLQKTSPLWFFVDLGFSPTSLWFFEERRPFGIFAHLQFFSNVFSMYFGWKLTYPTFYELFKGFGLLIKVVIEMQTSKTSILMCSYVSFYLFLLLGLRSVF